jgi:hypothetical protein
MESKCSIAKEQVRRKAGPVLLPGVQIERVGKREFPALWCAGVAWQVRRKILLFFT